MPATKRVVKKHLARRERQQIWYIKKKPNVKKYRRSLLAHPRSRSKKEAEIQAALFHICLLIFPTHLNQS